MSAGNSARPSVRGDVELRALPAQPKLAQLVEAQARTPGLFYDQPQAIVLYDLDGRIVVGNTAAVTLLGHPQGTLVGSHFSAHLAPHCIAAAHRVSQQAALGEAQDFEAVFVHADGHPVNVSTTVIPARFGGEVVGLYGIVREVQREREIAAAVEQADRFRSLYLIAASSGKTAQQQIEEALALGVELLGVESGIVLRLTEGALVPSYTVGTGPIDTLGVRLDAAACSQLFGSFDPVAVDDAERPPWDREPLHSILPWRSFIATTFSIGGTFAGIVIFAAQSVRGELFSNADREFVRLVSAVIGSTIERQTQQERLDMLAFSDTLTGLPNRALLQDRLQQLIADSRRNHESFAVHFLDLDGFKHVNDTAGHADGDKVLREAAQRLKDGLRESDSVARLGGDEFIILQKHVREPREAIALARTLLDLMRLPFLVENGVHVLSASIGISIFPADGDSANTLIRHADVALYRAKSLGRNGFALYGGTHSAAPSVRKQAAAAAD
jgi:diguanylate cyclase (GGDEF)-like protein/PAS domain S-box-containing protein